MEMTHFIPPAYYLGIAFTAVAVHLVTVSRYGKLLGNQIPQGFFLDGTVGKVIRFATAQAKEMVKVLCPLA
jgi:hypothetical protein